MPMLETQHSRDIEKINSRVRSLLYERIEKYVEGKPQVILSNIYHALNISDQERGNVISVLRRLGFDTYGKRVKRFGGKQERVWELRGGVMILARQHSYVVRWTYENDRQVRHENWWVIIPDQVREDLSGYERSQTEFVAQVVKHEYSEKVPEKGIRLRVERGEHNEQSFVFVKSRQKSKEPTQWVIRVHLGDKIYSVRDTRGTRWQLERVARRWREKIVSPGLATALRACALGKDEWYAWHDPADARFRVSIRPGDPDRPPPVIVSLEQLRWGMAR